MAARARALACAVRGEDAQPLEPPPCQLRWATEAQLDKGTLPRLPVEQLDDPAAETLARYWVAGKTVKGAVPSGWERGWLLGWRDMQPPLRQALHTRLRPRPVENINITAGKYGADAAQVGGATLLADQAFQNLERRSSRRHDPVASVRQDDGGSDSVGGLASGAVPGPFNVTGPARATAICLTHGLSSLSTDRSVAVAGARRQPITAGMKSGRSTKRPLSQALFDWAQVFGREFARPLRAVIACRPTWAAVMHLDD